MKLLADVSNHVGEINFVNLGCYPDGLRCLVNADLTYAYTTIFYAAPILGNVKISSGRALIGPRNSLVFFI